jgi:plastocyanin
MLILSRTGFLTLLAAASLFATAASAQTAAYPVIDATTGTATEEDTSNDSNAGGNSFDHEVIIIDGAYFPPFIYASIGDRIIFRNASSGAHIVEGPDESWSSGQIAVGGFFRLNLLQDTPLTFRASVDTEGTGAADGDVVLEQIGEITYDAPPSNS